MTELQKKEQQFYKRIIFSLSAIIIILLVIIIFMMIKMNKAVVEKDKTVSYNIELRSELDSLLSEHENIKAEYGHLSELLTEQDSIIMSQANEIEKLINSQADYRRIKRQLDYLRGITQGYVNQIDSLYQINVQLTEENVEIKKTLKTEKQRSIELQKDKVFLEEQITTAAILKAYNVNASALNASSSGRERDTERARRVNAIRVCFTVSENHLVSDGTKDIFMRIARPDNLILTQGGYSFIFQGERIQYSEKTSIQYNRKSQNVCITYRNDDIEFMKGIYVINLFADDHEIGQGSFELK